MARKRNCIAGFVLIVFLFSKFFSITANAYELQTPINRSEIAVDRLAITYSQTANYREYLKYRMNCYGYSLQVYSLSGSESTPYKQLPGEFVRDNETFFQLYQEYINLFSGNYSGDEILDFIEEKIVSDFATLQTYSGSEWVIVGTSANASVPSGYRKIALSVGVYYDFHFYMRHSDGTWSHKPGAGSVTDKSIDTHITITDSNIATVASEGGYDDGTRYYLIKKAGIIDYPHNNGHNTSSLYTSTSFSDKAGDVISKSGTLNSFTQSGRFDYPLDVDYYVFSPAYSGMYSFTTSLSSSTYDLDMVIFDSEGNILDSDYSIGNPEIELPLTSGYRYFIKVVDARSNVTSYTLFITD